MFQILIEEVYWMGEIENYSWKNLMLILLLNKNIVMWVCKELMNISSPYGHTLSFWNMAVFEVQDDWL